MKRLRSIILLVVAMLSATALAQKTLEEYVYWIDNDISASQSLGVSGVTINVGSLSKGVHTFTMRVKDSKGLWSSPVTKYFLIPRLKETGVGIVRYMYWFDEDVDNGVVVETNGNNDIVNVEVGGLSEGKHTINWRVGDSTGKWSQQVNSHLFNYVLPPTGIGALSSDINLALHDNLQAGYCTEYDAELEHILVEDLTTIPANTGVLLRGRGSEKVTLLEAEDNAVAEDNQLIAAIGKTQLTQSEAIDVETNFLIGSVNDWKEFVAQVSSKPDLNAVMTADIDLGDDQTKIGTYKGVFDGQGHTLTVHLTGGDNISPFVTISNAQIKNLHVAGTITVSGMRGSGIASYVAGNSTISNCHSSVIITTSRSGDFDGSGFIGRVNSGNNVTLTDCLFDGQLLKSGSANSCGGFVGWTQDGASATLENCLFNPSAPVTIDASSSYVDKLRTFVSGYSGGTITNCYYTSTYGEVQGTDATGMGTSDLVSAFGAGWEIQNNQVVPIMTINSGDYTNFYLNDSRFLKVESLVILPTNRSYLRLPSSIVGETKVVKLWWGNEELSPIATGFIPIENGKLKIENEANTWYTIDGRKLSGKPTAKGIYIHNGKKIILK
ncbi:MAG: hypothetical protein IKX65_03520 [Prevotella sp.]|nr:hypothetical protein [Prevotella sp.]